MTATIVYEVVWTGENKDDEVLYTFNNKGDAIYYAAKFFRDHEEEHKIAIYKVYMVEDNRKCIIEW